MAKWMLYVATRRRRRIPWRQANATFVATMRVGVGPGVKMDWKRSVRKADIFFCGSGLEWEILRVKENESSFDNVDSAK
jgi:hypothetical protein